MPDFDRMPRRLRHELRLRHTQVLAVQRVTPKMVRVTVGGEGLRGFHSPAYDDHLKLFFAPEGADLVLPFLSDAGMQFPRGVTKPEMRDYTPRRFDAEALRLDIDFVIHGAGPASSWAEAAKPGDPLVIGGPRGSVIVPDAFDWYLLAGDETALPAIGRRLEGFRPDQRALAVIEVAGPEEEQKLQSKADAMIVWVHRQGAPAGTVDALEQALREIAFPAGDPFAFVAAEGKIAQSIRRYLTEERGLNAEWVKASGYWSLGEASKA